MNASSDDSSELFDLINGPDPLPEPAPVVKVPPPSGPKRAGYTTNKGKPRNRARARMAKVSRVRNRR